MSIMDTLVTDRTQADVDARNDKGTYNASDLNRVGAAVAYVAGRLLECGTSVDVSPKQDWPESDTPTASQMERYRSDVAALRDALAAMPNEHKLAKLPYFEKCLRKFSLHLLHES